MNSRLEQSVLDESAPVAGNVPQADTTITPLAERVRSGIAWNASSSLLVQATGLARVVVVARLLPPADFGLFGMALTVIAALNAVTAIKLEQSIIAQQFDSEKSFHKHLNTVWSAELIRSALLSLLILAAAYPASQFYRQPKLTLLIALVSLATLTDGFRNIGVVVLRKEISFARLFGYEQAANLSATALMILLAFTLRNVWVLVLGYLATSVFSVLFSFAFHPFRPKFAIDPPALRTAFRFGRFVFVIAFASYLTTMADNVAVGRMLGAQALGIYALAYNVASFPVNVLVNAMTNVTFPAYARLASRPERLERAFARVAAVSTMLLAMISLPMFLFAREIIQLVFGERWLPAGQILWVLVLIVPLRGLVLIISAVFMAVNRPKLVAVGKASEAALFLVLLYPLMASLGLVGAAWAGVIAYAFAFLNRFLALKKIAPQSARLLLRHCLITLVASGPGLLAGGLSRTVVNSPLLQVVIGGFVSVGILSVILLATNSELRQWAKQSIFLNARQTDAAV